MTQPMRIRHAKECPVGTHCEDPLCHYNGSCTCEAETLAQLARKDAPWLLARLKRADGLLESFGQRRNGLAPEVAAFLAGEDDSNG